MTNAEKLNELVKKEFGTEGQTFYYFCKIIHVTDSIVNRHFAVTVNIGIFGKKK